MHCQRGWNHHSIRTENNHSPHQLFVRGSLLLREEYGVEEEGIVPQASSVNVPETQFALLDEHYDTLCQHVNPLAPSDNYGIELYQQALQVIANIVSMNPSRYS